MNDIKLKNILMDVISLSNTYHSAFPRNDVIQAGSSERTEEQLELRMKLVNYLEALEHDAVLTIRAIMYEGRDEFYAEKMSTAEAIKEWNKTLGTVSKSVDVDQIVSKRPLSEYLENGMRRLGLN